MKRKIQTLIYLSIGILALIAGAQIVSTLTSSLPIKAFTEKIGLWGPIFLTAGVALGGIFVPMTCLPFLLVGLSLYGYWATLVIYYFGNTIIAPIVDFWIARKYGRPIVVKLAGKKSLEQIDKIAEILGVKILIILRIFGGILFDSVSYAVGLTDIKFDVYFLLTGTLPIPGMAITLYFVNKGIIVNPLYLAIIIVWGYGAGLLTIYLVHKETKKRIA